MKRYRVLACMLVLAGLFLVVSSAAFAAPVGTVTAVQGRADITRGGDPARPVALDDEVFVGDFLRTKSDARLEVTFIDGTVSRMSSRSRLRVTEFLFDAGKREGTLDLLRGKVRSVVAGASPDSTYEVHTPTAVCGVRGTQFIVAFQNGITRGATVSGTVYTYSRGRPGEIRTMGPGQGFTLTDPDDVPQVQDIPEEDLQRDLDDTTMGGDGDDGDDGDGGTSGTVGDDLASGDDGTSGTTPPGRTTGGLDPGSDPNPPPATPSEPEPEPIIPEPEPPSGATLSGTVNDAYSSTSFDALFDMTALTGTITLSGTIKAPSDESGYGYSDPGWIVPLYFDNDTGTMDGMFAGKTGSWEGILSSIFLDGAENIYYLFGHPLGDTATASGGGIELGEGTGAASLTPAADMPEENSFGVVETESGSPYPLSLMLGENYSSYYSGSEGGHDYTSFLVDSHIILLDRTHRGYIEFAHDYYTYSEGGSIESDLYSDGSAYFYPHNFVGVVSGIDLSHEVWTNLPASLYANNGGTAAVAAHETGLIGGTYTAEPSWGTVPGDYMAMGTYDGDLGSGNHLWNSFVAFADGAEAGWTDLENVEAMLRGDSFQTSNLAFTFTTGHWLFNDPETNDTAIYGDTVGIYMDESGNAGLVYGFIPDGDYYPAMNMWMTDWGASIEFVAQGAYTLEGIDINPLAGYLYEDFPGGTISGAGAGASIEFIIPGDVGIRWGAYNLMFGSDDLPFSYSNTFSGNPGEVDVAFFGSPVLDEDTYLIGILGSSWYDGLVDGSISGIFVSDKGHGILGGPFYGTYDDADGTWIGASSGTFEETETFATLFSAQWPGPRVWLYPGYFDNQPESDIYGGDMPFYEEFVAGTDLGVWAFDVNKLYDQYGASFTTEETLPAGSWTLLGSVFDESLERLLVIDGKQWNEGPDGIEGRVAGSWITIDEALTGVMSGTITGEIIDGTTTWQAIARGVSIGTERFLSMADSDTGKAALDQMNIPFVQVGTTNLVQDTNGSQYLLDVYMNDVRFFSYSAGQAPVIWATGDVGGNWSGTPLSEHANLTGPGFEGGVDFSINRWESNLWNADVGGQGTVAGHTIGIQGGAAGAYTGDTSGTFTGTASGVAGPPDLMIDW